MPTTLPWGPLGELAASARRALVALALAGSLQAQPPPVAPAELIARRQQAAMRIPDGILVVHSLSGYKRWDESGFHQDPAFYYLTGLANLHRAIFVLDGHSKESWLFVAPPTGAFPDLTGSSAVALDSSAVARNAQGVDHIAPWTGFIPFVDSIRSARPSLVLYVDRGGQTGGQMGDVSNPAGLSRIENTYLLWADALRARWPDLEIRDAFPVVDAVRAVKSAPELQLLRAAASATAAGFWAGASSIAAGKTQRQVEGEVIAGCLRAGADGLSLWPWVRSGPYAVGSTLFEAFADYGNLDRSMKAGELVRLDVGCDAGMYKGDFGRTIPVSGAFTVDQRETLDLLNGAYLAGVAELRPGGTVARVWAATTAYVTSHQASLKSTMAREAAANALARPRWALHGLGLDMAEGAPAVFQPGNVLCYEPLFQGDAQAFFVEDTWEITSDGHRLINPDLPYAPLELTNAVAKARKSRRYATAFRAMTSR